MTFESFRTAGCLFAAMLAIPGLSPAVTKNACAAGAPTAESSTWDFPREASSLLKDVQADAAEIQDRADELRMFAQNESLSWESHAAQLMQIKEEVNDVAAKVCRLETIRAAVLPWQQKAIDRGVVFSREMANNTEQAIQYLNANHEHLWSPTYRQYASNLFEEGQHLSKTVQNYEQLAGMHDRERRIEKSMSAESGS